MPLKEETNDLLILDQTHREDITEVVTTVAVAVITAVDITEGGTVTTEEDTVITEAVTTEGGMVTTAVDTVIMEVDMVTEESGQLIHNYTLELE